MDIVEFEDMTARYWVPPTITEHDATVNFIAMCMAGEAGEVCDALKKVTRQNGRATMEDVLLEIGDTLHYLTRLANYLGWSLEDVMDANHKKLSTRRQKEDGTEYAA